MEANKDFIIIWHQNAIAYKEIFPLIKENKMWLWKWFKGWAWHFISNYKDYAVAWDHVEWMIRVSWVVWFSNIDHGRRHQPLWLMTMADNIKFSKHREIQGVGYNKYDNYDAIEVPFTDAIPSDYEWIMWVPVTFLDKYNPEQFEIIDINPHFFSMVEQWLPKPKQLTLKSIWQKDPYARILIRHKK